jgi:hypothetical protein
LQPPQYFTPISFIPTLFNIKLKPVNP